MAVTLKTDWATEDELEASELNKITKKIEAMTDGVYNSSDAPENIRVGTNNTDAALVIGGSLAATSSDPVALMLADSDESCRYMGLAYDSDRGATVPTYEGFRFGGSIASPTGTKDTTRLAIFSGGGSEDGVWANRKYGGWFEFEADGDWSASNHGTEAHLWITPNGSTSYFEALSVNGNYFTINDIDIALVNDGSDAKSYFTSYGGVARLLLRAANGTESSPTASISGDDIVKILAYGYNGSAFNDGGEILFEANENWNATDNGMRMSIRLVPDGSTSLETIIRIDKNGIDLPTSGDRYEREGTPITQKIVTITSLSRSTTGSNVQYTFTGLTGIHHIIAIMADVSNDDSISTGAVSADGSDEQCNYVNLNTSEASYAAKLIKCGTAEFSVDSISGNVLQGDWTGFTNSEQVTGRLIAFGY